METIEQKAARIKRQRQEKAKAEFVELVLKELVEHESAPKPDNESRDWAALCFTMKVRSLAMAKGLRRGGR